MLDRIAVVAGLDVHKASTRVVAVQRDRLLWEGTVASDPPLVEAALRRVGVVACCYEAGPTGTVSRGIWGRSVSAAMSSLRVSCGGSQAIV